MLLNLIITVVFPLLVFLYSFKLKKGKVFFLGCLVFILVQLLIRLPLLVYLSTNSLAFYQLQIQNPLLYIILLALSAGVVEQVGNYIMIRLFLKRDISWNDGIIFGLGHGCAEAFLLFGLPILMTFFSGMPGYFGLVVGIERLFAIILQVGLAVLVMKSIKSKKVIYLLMAILIHALVDSLIGIIPTFISTNSILIESILGVISLLLLLYVISLKKGWKIA